MNPEIAENNAAPREKGSILYAVSGKRKRCCGAAGTYLTPAPVAEEPRI